MAPGSRLVLRKPNGGDLGLCEDDVELQPVIHGFKTGITAKEAGGIAGGAFSLFDGDVNDLEWSGAIACGKDMLRRGLLMRVNRDRVLFEFDARFLQAQAP